MPAFIPPQPRLGLARSTPSAFMPRGIYAGQHETTPPVLDRNMLARGMGMLLARQDDPAIWLSSEAERAASLNAFLKYRPAGDIWVFAYGSLIWNPAIKTMGQCVARLSGWHRSFCLSMTAGRGTAAQPGLALGLDHGGDCLGIAYRIAQQDVQSELSILWSREMFLGGYIPKWVEITDQDGHPVASAMTFVIDPSHRNYAGDLSTPAIIRRLATAAGSWGSAADYLFRTLAALREHQIHDAHLEKIGALVTSSLLCAGQV